MDNVREMVVQISILSLITGLISAVKPYGKFDSQMKLVTSCILLIGLLSPFLSELKNLDTYFDFSIPVSDNAEELQEIADEEIIRMAEEELIQTLKLKLAEESVPCSRITIDMNTNDNGSINITSVSVVSTKPDDAERVLRNILGEEVKIYAERNY